MELPLESQERLTHRRADLRLSFRKAAARSGLAVGTWQRAEGGGSVSYQSLVTIVKALEWPPDAIDRLLEGLPPITDEDPDPTTPTPAAAGRPAGESEEIGLAAKIGKLPPESRAKLTGYLDALFDELESQE